MSKHIRNLISQGRAIRLCKCKNNAIYISTIHAEVDGKEQLAIAYACNECLPELKAYPSVGVISEL